ncbi:MAG TPA: hypothetical protein VFL53_08195 [Pseudolabrys sp.]|nr:hypothetical protein [Pseudolabrys sp.]
MCLKVRLYVVAICAVAAASATAVSAATRPRVVAATFAEYSVSPPTPDMVIVCHGFGCKYRAEVDLTAADRARLAQFLAAGRGSAAAERKAVAAAGAWFDKRVGPLAGTEHHVARAGMKYMFDIHQFDCIDSSRNTTSLLMVLDQLNLLRYHDVDEPEARGYMVDGRPPHATAVLVERATGKKWSIDSWTVGYGQALEVMPLERWKELD